MPVAASIASGNFAGMGGGHRDHRRAARAGMRRAAAAMPIGGMRVGEIAGGGVQPADLGQRPGIVQAKPVEQRGAPGARRPRAPAMWPVGAEVAHRRGGRRGVAVQQLEQQALEVGADLDVHARRQAGLDALAPTCRWRRGSGPGCRCGWSRPPGAPPAAPCGARPRRPGRCRNCRSARRRPPRGPARRAPARRRRSRGSARRCAPS